LAGNGQIKIPNDHLQGRVSVARPECWIAQVHRARCSIFRGTILTTTKTSTAGENRLPEDLLAGRASETSLCTVSLLITKSAMEEFFRRLPSIAEGDVDAKSLEFAEPVAASARYSPSCSSPGSKRCTGRFRTLWRLSRTSSSARTTTSIQTSLVYLVSYCNDITYCKRKNCWKRIKLVRPFLGLPYSYIVRQFNWNLLHHLCFNGLTGKMLFYLILLQCF
jgi:hypothetical protein